MANKNNNSYFVPVPGTDLFVDEKEWWMSARWVGEIRERAQQKFKLTLGMVRRQGAKYLSRRPRQQCGQLLGALYLSDEFVYVGSGGSPKTLLGDCFAIYRLFALFSNTKDRLQPLLGINPAKFYPPPLEQPATSFVDPHHSWMMFSSYRYMVANCDGGSVDEQLKLWRVAGFPVCALVYDGNETVYAWIKVDCKDRKDWKNIVLDWFYPQVLSPLGISPECTDPARRVPLPGYKNRATGRRHELLQISPKKGNIIDTFDSFKENVGGNADTFAVNAIL